MNRAVNITLSLLIPICLTVLFNIIFFPLLNSGDDAFSMYVLSGGYGQAPSELVQYHYGWHYWLGSITAFLFTNFPGINWYTIILLIAHVGGMSLILNVLLNRQGVWFAILLFLTGFIFIESRFLLSPNFSNSAFVGATGAITFLLHHWKKKEWRWMPVVVATFLMLLAVLLRFHMVVFAVLLFVPVILLVRPFVSAVKFVGCLALFVIFSFLIYKLHADHYRKQVPGWDRQESFRQDLFYAYNRPVDTSRQVFRDSVEREKFFSFFMYDTVEFSSKRVKTIAKGITRKARLNREDLTGFYWTFLDLRIYLLLFASILICARVNGQRKVFKRWLPAFLVFGLIQVLLFLFLKGTMNLYLGTLFFLWLQLCLSLDRIPVNDRGHLNKLFAGWIFLLGLWMGWRLYKEDLVNRNKNERLHCVLAEIRSHPDNLFIVFGDIFYLSHFYTWDLPARHPLPNVLYKDRMISFTYGPVLKQFGINDVDSALKSDQRILIVGNPRFVETRELKDFGCIPVRQKVN